MVNQPGRGPHVDAIEKSSQFTHELGGYSPVMNHMYSKDIRLEPDNYPSDVVYRPGQEVTFTPPQHPLNFRASRLTGTLHVGEIKPPTDGFSMRDVVHAYRTRYRESILSRPGAVFDTFPLPVHDIDKAKYISSLGWTSASSFSTEIYGGENKFSSYKSGVIDIDPSREYIKSQWKATADVSETKKFFQPVKSSISDHSLDSLVSVTREMPTNVQTGNRDTEPGYVLDKRSVAYGMVKDVDDYDRFRMYDRYSDGNVITPDEAISTWDSYGHYFDNLVTPNALYGYFCRSAFKLFSQIRVGTPSNPNLFEDNSNTDITAIMKFFEFENDHFNNNRTCYWSSARIPEVFGWRGYTNTKLLGITEAYGKMRTKKNGESKYKEFGLSEAESDINPSQIGPNIARTHPITVNPDPFYFPAQDIPFSIPLSDLSQCLNTDLHLNQNPVNSLKIMLRLAGLDDVFDMGVVDGYHEGEALVDMLSMGRLTDFIRFILNINNWSGWYIKGLRMQMRVLDINTAELMNIYLPTFMQGHVLPYNELESFEIARFKGSDLTRMATAPQNMQYKLQFGQGIIAGLAFYAKIDGVNNAYVPIFDTMALQFGTSPTMVNYPDDLHQPYTLADMYQNTLFTHGKTDTFISNMPNDVVYGYGVPEHRRRLFEHEYWAPTHLKTHLPSIEGGFPETLSGLPKDSLGLANLHSTPQWCANETIGDSDFTKIYKEKILNYDPSKAAPYDNYYTRISPLTDIRNIHSIYSEKKMNGHEHTCIVEFDLRGDAPTPGSRSSAVMSGVDTTQHNTAYGNLNLTFRDTSLYERYKNRDFTIHMVVVLERLMNTRVSMDEAGNWRTSYDAIKDMQVFNSMNNNM